MISMVFGWGKKKQKEEPAEKVPQATREISLADVPKILSELVELRKSQTLSEINNIRNNTQPLIDDLAKIANVLEKDNLNVDDIDRHLAIIVVRGKKQVIDVMKKNVVSLPKIKSFDDAEKLNVVLGQTLKKIGDVLGRQTRVIHIFAKKYASQLKENLEVMNANHSEIRKFLKNFNSAKLLSDEITDGLDQIAHLTNSRQEKSKKISEIQNTLFALSEKITSIQSEIEKIKSSDRYKSYVDLKAKLNTFATKKSKIKNDINTQFTKISRPLSRYEYASSLDKEQKSILSTLVSEPFDALTPQNKDSVIIILENVRKGVFSGSISVKDVDKTSSQITEIEESLDGFVRQISDYYKQHEKIKDDLGSLMSDELISFESDLAKNAALLDGSKLKSKTLQGEIDETDSKIPKLILEIEQKLRQFSNIHYVLLTS